MKKKLTIFITLLMAIFCAIGFVACGGVGETSSGSNDHSLWKRYNDSITYRLSYTSEKECPNGNIVDRKLHSSMEFEIDEVYFMVLDFKISSFETEGWQNSFSSAIKISPSSVINARLEEAATGSFTERVESNITHIITKYSIPESRSEAKTYRLTIRFTIDEDCSVNIGLLFYGDGENVNNVAMAEESICGYFTSGLKYELNENGTSYSVIGVGDADDAQIIIPSLYWGLPVSSIGDSAFFDCDNLTSITIPDSVTSIGDSAFFGCDNLTSITIPNSVTSIGYFVFSTCLSLESITVQKDNAVYHSADNCIIETESKTLITGCNTSIIPTDGSVTEIDENAFFGCLYLNNVTIPGSVTFIGDRAFAFCVRVENMVVQADNAVYHSAGNCIIETESKTLIAGTANSVIPDDGSVTAIDKYAFYGCSFLKSVIIPDAVTFIGSSAFSYCRGVVNMAVQTGNTVYHSAGNCIIETASKTLIAGCKNSVIPTDGSVTSIGDYAFEGRGSMISITIPTGVTSIGDHAFYACSELTNVNFANPTGWSVSGSADMSSAKSLDDGDLSDSETAARLLTDKYADYYWSRN